MVPKSGGGTQQLIWVDRRGTVLGSIGQPQESIRTPALSPDGRRVAIAATEENRNQHIWIQDIARGTKTRLTFDAAGDRLPVWSPAGDQIAFEAMWSGAGDIFIQAVDGRGVAHPLVTGPLREFAPDWARDGKYLIYQVTDPKTRNDLWYLPLPGERKPVPFLQTPFNEAQPAVSPDGRLVAYQSDEFGREEVFVKPFPTGEGKWQVSTKGGVHPGMVEETRYSTSESRTIR